MFCDLFDEQNVVKFTSRTEEKAIERSSRLTRWEIDRLLTVIVWWQNIWCAHPIRHQHKWPREVPKRSMHRADVSRLLLLHVRSARATQLTNVLIQDSMPLTNPIKRTVTWRDAHERNILIVNTTTAITLQTRSDIDRTETNTTMMSINGKRHRRRSKRITRVVPFSERQRDENEFSFENE